MSNDVAVLGPTVHFPETSFTRDESSKAENQSSMSVLRALTHIVRCRARRAAAWEKPALMLRKRVLGTFTPLEMTWIPIGLTSASRTRATRYSTSGVTLSGSSRANNAFVCGWTKTQAHITVSFSSFPVPKAGLVAEPGVVPAAEPWLVRRRASIAVARASLLALRNTAVSR